MSSSELPVPVTALILGSNSDIAHAPSEHVSVSVPVPQLQLKCIVQVHRLNNKKDLTDIFRNSLIMSQEMKIIVIEARGVEEVGMQCWVAQRCLLSFLERNIGFYFCWRK